MEYTLLTKWKVQYAFGENAVYLSSTLGEN